MPSATASRPRVQSVARAMQMVDAVARSPHGLTAREMSEATGVSRAGTYHLLHTLMQTGVLGRAGRRYIVGMRASVFAAGLASHTTPLQRIAATARGLAQSTRATVVAAAWGAPGITVIGRAGGGSDGGELTRGFAGHAHARASGKLLLAYASAAARDAYLATHPLLPRTDKTLVEPAQLARELAEVRRRGYAIDEEEFTAGVCCIAAPLEIGHGRVALSVVTSAERFRDEQQRLLGALLCAAATSGVPPLAAP